MSTYETIKLIICQGEEIIPSDLDGSWKYRKRELVFARQLIFYFMRIFTKESLTLIGSRMGKDHATVLHACKQINNLIDTDKTIAIRVMIYKEKIGVSIDLNYKGIMKSLDEIKQIIQHCTDNGLLIPEDILVSYNHMIRDGKGQM